MYSTVHPYSPIFDFFQSSQGLCWAVCTYIYMSENVQKNPHLFYLHVIDGFNTVPQEGMDFIETRGRGFPQKSLKSIASKKEVFGSSTIDDERLASLAA